MQAPLLEQETQKAIATANEIVNKARQASEAELARIMVDADIEALDCEGKPWIDKPMLSSQT